MKNKIISINQNIQRYGISQEDVAAKSVGLHMRDYHFRKPRTTSNSIFGQFYDVSHFGSIEPIDLSKLGENDGG